jgi:hypothetical protein
MPLNVSAEMKAKLVLVQDLPILDSVFIKNADGTQAEKVLGTKGVYIASEVDGWQLRGPFPLELGA